MLKEDAAAAKRHSEDRSNHREEEWAVIMMVITTQILREQLRGCGCSKKRKKNKYEKARFVFPPLFI